MARSEVRAAALDVGSSAIKGGLLDGTGELTHLQSIPAPSAHGEGELREADPEAYLAVTGKLLRELASMAPPGVPLGLTGQRSSFTLWEPKTGQARIPLISWQDRRGASWCEQHRGAQALITRRTGLALSAHYVGPKLAALQEQDPTLARELHDGRLLFGNLDAYLLWHWSGGKTHETELSMAARTCLVDLGQASWCDELLRLFHVPATSLPRLVSSGGRETPLEPGPVLAASLADQASAALTVLDGAERSALINLGTGGFVLLPTSEAELRIPGYLTAPILGAADGRHRFAVEGTISGAGTALGRFGSGPTPLPDDDPTPDAFAVPDAAGLGSPHWLPGFEATLSQPARSLAVADRRRTMLEGLLFRVREILEGLSRGPLPQRILLSGGLAREPSLARGLAAVLDRSVEVLEQEESTLLGVARLAAGLEPFALASTRTVEPARPGRYLRAKYGRWFAWYRRLLSDRTDP